MFYFERFMITKQNCRDHEVKVHHISSFVLERNDV